MTQQLPPREGAPRRAAQPNARDPSPHVGGQGGRSREQRLLQREVAPTSHLATGHCRPDTALTSGVDGRNPTAGDYAGTLYRPPSEARSLVVQATIGCSYNECAFCGMYRDKKFRVRRLADVTAEIDAVRQHTRDVRRVFLTDGDALIAPPSYLHGILLALRAAFPDLERVSCYASPQALQIRTVSQMEWLREAGLAHYYLGVESGHDEVLARLTKGVDADEMIRVGQKARAADVGLSTMVLLGAGGLSLSLEHARESARVINGIRPTYVSTLVMTPVEGTPLFEQVALGQVEAMTAHEITRELREFVAHLDCDGTIFRANHSSNYLPIGGTLPHDKRPILASLDVALARRDGSEYVPDSERRL